MENNYRTLLLRYYESTKPNKENEWPFEIRLEKIKRTLESYENPHFKTMFPNYRYNRKEIPSKEDLNKLEILMKNCSRLNITINPNEEVSFKGVVENLLGVFDSNIPEKEIFRVQV